MMANGRINPGQRLNTAISARAWNRAQDAADIVLGDRGGLAEAAGGRTARAGNVIRIRSPLNQEVPVHAVLQLFGPIISPVGGQLNATGPADAAAKQFNESIVMSTLVPNANSSRVCITLEPIASNGFGRAAVAGVIACKVKLPTSGTFSYAVTRQGDYTQLLASSCGPVRLLWHETGPGDDKWAVALLS
jgi:hypothetical protein